MKTKPDTAETASLEEQYAVLQHLYGTAPVGLCLLDPDLRYVQINGFLSYSDSDYQLLPGAPANARARDRIADLEDFVRRIEKR